MRIHVYEGSGWLIQRSQKGLRIGTPIWGFMFKF